MKMGKAFPSKYVSAADIESPRVMTINEVVIVEFEEDGTEKPMMTFDRAVKGLILNKTNWLVTEELYGDETEGWRGKQIELYPTTTHFGGKMVPCVRVRAPRSLQQEAPPIEAPVPEDDIPF